MLKNRPKAKILVDGGDPAETARIRQLLGFVDGQTTNPSLVAKNPDIRKRIAAGRPLSRQEANEAYRDIVRGISSLVGDAGVSIEVFADINTPAEHMFAEGREMYSWIPNAYIKFPCTHEGLRAAAMSVNERIRVNMTLCFSQEQAAAVYGATRGTREPAYVSPFVGRLDDRGENGMDLVKNICEMYKSSDHHVHVLAASIRGVDHLLSAFALGAELVTVPAKILEEWSAKGFPMPGPDFSYQAATPEGRSLKPLDYKAIDLKTPWENLNIAHDLTTQGIHKFVQDYWSTLKKSA
ncbi:MAG TPA: transaldolase family protein [Terracidiphilus sp.]|nr:transaldolase family protein [Terracidiphilus sp.]